MPDAVCFVSWESYAAGTDGRGFFQQEPLTFNSARPDCIKSKSVIRYG